MTDFFERQSIARTKTKLLLCYFVPAVALTILGIYFVVLFGLCFHTSYRGRHYDYARHLFTPTNVNWHLLGVVAVVTVVCVAIASLYKASLLSDGGHAVAAMLGGRQILPNTTNPDELRLRNVVEEMAIASGVTVPEIFVLDDEGSINAFVVGHNASDAALGVTNGAMRLLNRDELQAVVGHEFSHLLNGDMGLNIWLMSLLFGILFIAITGKFLLQVESGTSSSSRRNTGGIVLLGVGLFVIGSIGYFCARLIKCAVCRERECLADASSVQFTRNPIALASALKKIGGLSYGSRILSAEADEASHLFFADVMSENGMFSTHPSLTDRIRLLDPSFDGKFEPIQGPPPRKVDPTRPIQTIMDVPGINRMPPATVLQIAQVINQRNEQTPAPPKPRFTPAHLTYAAGLAASFPPEIDAIVREPFGASAFVYAMLLSCDEAARQKQLTDIAGCADQSVINAAMQYLPTVNALSKGQKLGLISIAIPALRHMSPLQFDSFSKTVQLLVESDSEISLFEYNIQKSIRRHLEPRFKLPTPAIAQYYAAAGLSAECAVLFSALAYQSSIEGTEVARAFRCGADDLQLPPQKQIALLPKDDCNLVQIDAAVQKITQASFPVKKQILNACALVVAADSVVKEEEAEMLRAIADAIGCPLPPFVSSVGIPEAA